MKIITKRFILIIMIVMLMFSLTGCNENNNNSNNNVNNATSQTTVKVKSNDDVENVADMDFLYAAEQQMSMPQKGETIAIIHVKDYGDIKVKFFKNKAPKAVENFVKHSQEGYYNGVTFHRVINDFMIQGGDPTGTGAGGQSIWGKDFEDEFSYDLLPYRGALCMANAGVNTNGSQFFIEQAKYNENVGTLLEQNNYQESFVKAYKKYGGSIQLFGVHTVFGQVIEGMDVVDKIASTETDEKDRPVEDVIIESIEITEF